MRFININNCFSKQSHIQWEYLCKRREPVFIIHKANAVYENDFFARSVDFVKKFEESGGFFAIKGSQLFLERNAGAFAIAQNGSRYVKKQ